MATDPEALTQLSRLLGVPLAHAASRDQVLAAIEQHFDGLVNGIVSEAAASDDVYDRESAYEFVDSRLEDFAGWLSAEQATRLRMAVRGKIEAW